MLFPNNISKMPLCFSQLIPHWAVKKKTGKYFENLYSVYQRLIPETWFWIIRYWLKFFIIDLANISIFSHSLKTYDRMKIILCAVYLKWTISFAKVHPIQSRWQLNVMGHINMGLAGNEITRKGILDNTMYQLIRTKRCR